ncbi:hypothetical protein [Halomonas saccharevitans]|uniref:CVNH domain-containing protein n=1 Tax=Halomonas saccharevitans TaxID=416872 RepID=A0A1I6YWE6_9GAMM|nr:hypothetical protein [Halomonas saccharevitans]SFT54860.1 hypothetical protein SAMN04487956_107103 [Halomonas saccharevitans]
MKAIKVAANAAVLGTCLVSISVGAQQVPRFNVEAHCEQVASISGDSSNMLYNSCIDIEQTAYSGLKGQWSSLPANIQNHCRDVASVTGPGSYSLLESCVDMEVSAGNNRSEFSFD